MTREEAIMSLKKVKMHFKFSGAFCDNTRAEACESIDMAIESLSAERPKGEWQKVDEQPYFRKHFDNVCCSVCHHKGMRKYNYCPNCGAKMKGGAE